MTTLLKKAFDLVSSLPQPEQERLAARWIAEIRAERTLYCLPRSSEKLSEMRHENDRLLESLNAAYDDLPNAEELRLQQDMRRYHRRFIGKNAQW
ncbi:hypothetical protein [Desulfonema magnum]|uniref:Uncharacterized protein n=1 Tax=Desulfonema magnum TaxID=45655 RepID=A0A975GMQ7_9BACT|nr:hypothetical protein [Desulfonema magnum]QTA86023.1 Uncharacterized protein dnm_020410 [Desulfonema magnum]